MKRLLIALLISILPAVSVARDVNPIDRVTPSVVRLTGYKETLNGTTIGNCSAFAVNQHERLYLTAQHCVRDVDHTTLDEHKIQVLKEDKLSDLALVRGVIGRKALQPSTRQVEEGTATTAIGYPNGSDFTRRLSGKVVLPLALLEFPTLSDTVTVFEKPFIPGMSGGPVVDEAGAVVSIIQGTIWRNKFPKYEHGVGRPLGHLKMFLGDKWR